MAATSAQLLAGIMLEAYPNAGHWDVRVHIPPLKINVRPWSRTVAVAGPQYTRTECPRSVFKPGVPHGPR